LKSLRKSKFARNGFFTPDPAEERQKEDDETRAAYYAAITERQAAAARDLNDTQTAALSP
jgi:hypothetical protein